MELKGLYGRIPSVDEEIIPHYLVPWIYDVLYYKIVVIVLGYCLSIIIMIILWIINILERSISFKY